MILMRLVHLVMHPRGWASSSQAVQATTTLYRSWTRASWTRPMGLSGLYTSTCCILSMGLASHLWEFLRLSQHSPNLSSRRAPSRGCCLDASLRHHRRPCLTGLKTTTGALGRMPPARLLSTSARCCIRQPRGLEAVVIAVDSDHMCCGGCAVSPRVCLRLLPGLTHGG